jgi:4-aminobutyrate aminotransferase/(S)-3-amino-2-methylpropionate transaminase
MMNHPPGSPALDILSFEKSFHGRTLGTLSSTRSKPIHKLDIPAFNWPKAPFPVIRYPLEENVSENRREEDQCLEQFESIIRTWHNPIAAIIIEPIQGEGGDNQASSYFYQKLRSITKKYDILMIVDEVYTI